MKLKVKVAIVLNSREAAMSLHMMEGYASMRKDRSGIPDDEERFLQSYRAIRGQVEEIFRAVPDEQDVLSHSPS